MSKILALLVLLQGLSLLSADFTIYKEPHNIISPLRQLGTDWNVSISGEVSIFLRQHNELAPGDYYRYPLGAKRDTLSIADYDQINLIIQSTIKNTYYDIQMIAKITGLHYRLYQDSIRYEYFIRYSLADTIYVISGWKDKFLSFYRTVPCNFKFNLSELNKKISEVAAIDISIPKDVFEHCSRDNPYFIEYVDRDQMLRVRCYHISEQRKGQDNPLVTDPYTLIEITRFLDKEMVP